MWRQPIDPGTPNENKINMKAFDMSVYPLQTCLVPIIYSSTAKWQTLMIEMTNTRLRWANVRGQIRAEY
jgi:hypothetical protein